MKFETKVLIEKKFNRKVNKIKWSFLLSIWVSRHISYATLYDTTIYMYNKEEKRSEEIRQEAGKSRHFQISLFPLFFDKNPPSS